MKMHADTQWDTNFTIRMCEIGKWLLLLTVILEWLPVVVQMQSVSGRSARILQQRIVR